MTNKPKINIDNIFKVSISASDGAQVTYYDEPARNAKTRLMIRALVPLLVAHWSEVSCVVGPKTTVHTLNVPDYDCVYQVYSLTTPIR